MPNEVFPESDAPAGNHETVNGDSSLCSDDKRVSMRWIGVRWERKPLNGCIMTHWVNQFGAEGHLTLLAVQRLNFHCKSCELSPHKGLSLSPVIHYLLLEWDEGRIRSEFCNDWRWTI
jgi:hypothetical protein